MLLADETDDSLPHNIGSYHLNCWTHLWQLGRVQKGSNPTGASALMGQVPQMSNVEDPWRRLAFQTSTRKMRKHETTE